MSLPICLIDAGFIPALLTASAMAIACAVLSVFVVARRWAFVGEGISHSGFGGAGTAWLLALAFPALERPWVPYVGVILFCLVTALGIGYLSRSRRVSSDTAIGIFLVASLAWGFVAQNVYYQKRHASPPGWDTLLFGHMAGLTPTLATGAILICAAVVGTVIFLKKEIVYYCFDPAMAAASGVRAGFIHYLLMLLVALTIIVGVPVAGSVLVTALLVLPGATALMLTRRLSHAVALSIVLGLAGALSGVAVSRVWGFVPTGPAIVLALFAQFVLAFGWTKAHRGTAR